MRKSRALVVGLATVAGSSAMAAVPTEVSTAITSMTTDVGDYSSAFIPLAVAVAMGFVGIKWLKRFINKAT